MHVRNQTRGSILANAADVADTSQKRRKGLLKHLSLADGEGLWISPCEAVHTFGMKFAIDYYGIDNVMYGTDYPCWDPAPCLKLLEDVKLSDADKQKLFYTNARRILGLKDSAPAKPATKREPALA